VKNKGLLVSIEGIDGSGKSSLAHALQKSLEAHDHQVILTKEPGDTPLGHQLRILLHEAKNDICDKAEYLLFAADRAQHFEQTIIPALEEGKVIISDRLDDSSVAYQGYGRGLDIDMIIQTNEWAMGNIKSDLTFYIKLDFTTALERIMQRGNKLTSFETEEKQFWKRVSDGFDKIFINRKNVIILDGKESIETLQKQATVKILELLKSGTDE